MAELSLGTPNPQFRGKILYAYLLTMLEIHFTFQQWHGFCWSAFNEGCIIVSNVNGYQTVEICSKITLTVPQSQGSVSGAQKHMKNPQRNAAHEQKDHFWNISENMLRNIKVKSSVTNEGPVAADGWQSALGRLWDIYESANSSSCNQHVNEPPRRTLFLIHV